MTTPATIKVNSDRPTYASDYLKSDSEEVVFLGNPTLDNMMTTLVALCSEIWADRRRGRVVEKLLAEKGISQEMIEGYFPSADDEAEWKEERDRFIAATLDPLMRQAHKPMSTDRDD
jgi:hypothetical protein